MGDGMSVCRAVLDHCCNLGRHGVCDLLRDDGLDADRRWVCTLRERLGSWEAVHTDPVYLSEVRPKLDEYEIVDCGDWPPPGTPCFECYTHLVVN